MVIRKQEEIIDTCSLNKINYHLTYNFEKLTYGDMIIILAKFMRSGDQLPFCYPLFKIIDFTIESEELKSFSELSPAFTGQILKAGIQLVNLITDKAIIIHMLIFR